MTMTVAEVNFKLARVREMSPVFHLSFSFLPATMLGRIHLGYGQEVNRRQEALLLQFKRKRTTMKRR